MGNPSTVGEDFLVDGTSLSTYAWNIWTLTGRERFPLKVGDNVQIPYRNGRNWVPKYYDQAQITLGMWVRGTDINGVIPPQGARAQFNSNLRALRTLFGPTGRLLQLQRVRLYVTGSETHTAQGEMASGEAGTQNEMDVQPITIRYGTFTVDITMPDPWWYGPVVNPSMTGAGVVINNPGEVTATSIIVTLNGPLNNPRLTNLTLNPNVSVTYNGTINAGQSVVVNCGTYTATQAGTSVIGSLSHAGNLAWMLLLPGNNTMSLTNAQGGVVGSGNAVISFSPPFV